MGYGRTNIAGGGLRIKSAQRGDTVLDWSTKEITINSVNVANSIIVVEVEMREVRRSHFWCSAKFKDSTHIVISHGAGYSTDPAATVHWYVYELAGFKSLQYVEGSINRSSAADRITSIEIPITTVNLNKTLVFRTVWLNDRSDKYAEIGFGTHLLPTSYAPDTSNRLGLTSYDTNSIDVSVHAFVVELR